MPDSIKKLIESFKIQGLQDKLIDGFNEVVRSNISKLDNNGKPIINGEDNVWDESRPLGKILKSSKYFPPNLSQFFVDEGV